MGANVSTKNEIASLKLNTIKKIKLGAPCKYNFYFIRHGFSCSNIQTTKIKDEVKSKIKQKYQMLKEIGKYSLNEDSHLTNWGIFSCNLLRKDYYNLFKDIKIDNLFISPLIRTWETAYLLFGASNINHFTIAPHIKEDNPLKYLPMENYTVQKERFKEFIEYVNYCDKLIDLNYNFKYNYPKYTIQEENYPMEYLNNSIDKFMKYYMKKYDKNTDFIKEKNVVVVCHSQLLENWLEKHEFNYNKNIPEKLKNRFNFLKDNNAYCIKITIDRSSKEDFYTEIINPGFPYPNKKELKDINIVTSYLCRVGDEEIISRSEFDRMLKYEYDIVKKIYNKQKKFKNIKLQKK